MNARWADALGWRWGAAWVVGMYVIRQDGLDVIIAPFVALSFLAFRLAFYHYLSSGIIKNFTVFIFQDELKATGSHLFQH